MAMLLNEIIEILTDTTAPVADALLKTKVLLHQIGRKDLVDWVNNELTGYPDYNVPGYRIVQTEARGHLVSLTWSSTNHPLPIKHLDDKTQEALTHYPLTDALPVLEDAIKKFRSKGTWQMRNNLPIEATGVFIPGLDDGVNVMSAWRQINMAGVENVLAEVRSRLLDFALGLQDIVGAEEDIVKVDKKMIREEAGKIFTTTINGSGNTVVMGSHSSQTVSVGNIKGDAEAMVKALADAGIPTEELKELRIAIAQDEKNGLVPVVKDGETGKWYLKLITRAVKGTVDVGVDVVSSVVAKVIAAYAGLPAA